MTVMDRFLAWQRWNIDMDMVADMPRDIAERVDPIKLIRPIYVVDSLPMSHMAVTLYARTDIVQGKRDLATNNGLGSCPTSACGLMVADREADNVRTVDIKNVSDVRCKRCRSIVESIVGSLSPQIKEGLW